MCEQGGRNQRVPAITQDLIGVGRIGRWSLPDDHSQIDGLGRDNHAQAIYSFMERPNSRCVYPVIVSQYYSHLGYDRRRLSPTKVAYNDLPFVLWSLSFLGNIYRFGSSSRHRHLDRSRTPSTSFCKVLVPHTLVLNTDPELSPHSILFFFLLFVLN